MRETAVSNSIRLPATNRTEIFREGLDFQPKQSTLKLEIQTNAKEHSTGGSSSTKIYKKALKQGSNYSETNKHLNDSPNENQSSMDLRGLDSHRDSEQDDRPQSERPQYHNRKNDLQTIVDRRMLTYGETMQSESTTKDPKEQFAQEFDPKLTLKKPNDPGLATKGKMHKRGNLNNT